jgi:thiol-disulfide isomerase/thioredoxin
MRWPCIRCNAGLLSGLTAVLCLPAMALGQDVKIQLVPAPTRVLQPPAANESVKSINDEYSQQVQALERRRIERLARLAARQNPADAAATYEQLFRLAAAANMYGDAEQAADTVAKAGSPALITRALAYFVKVIAESDRGAYEQSLESLKLAVAEKTQAAQTGLPAAQLSTTEIVAICDAYYQRLIQGAQYDKAKKALQVLLASTQNSILKAFVSSRLTRLEQIGKPAPTISGTDLDGKPFNRAVAKGKVTLVVFWASWSLPSGAEIDTLQQVAELYRAQGFQIVGINLDTLQDDGNNLATVMPNVRHFLLDHNVRWPTLINGQGENDYAKAYGITEIPANVVVGRNGTVTHIDLVTKNFESMIGQAVRE